MIWLLALPFVFIAVIVFSACILGGIVDDEMERADDWEMGR